MGPEAANGRPISGDGAGRFQRSRHFALDAMRNRRSGGSGNSAIWPFIWWRKRTTCYPPLCLLQLAAARRFRFIVRRGCSIQPDRRDRADGRPDLCRFKTETLIPERMCRADTSKRPFKCGLGRERWAVLPHQIAVSSLNGSAPTGFNRLSPQRWLVQCLHPSVHPWIHVSCRCGWSIAELIPFQWS